MAGTLRLEKLKFLLQRKIIQKIKKRASTPLCLTPDRRLRTSAS
jgi:hypothetical protein